MSVPLLCIEDYEAEAARRLPLAPLDFYRSGATSQITLKENKLAIQSWYIRPRFLRDMTQHEMSTTILGHKVSVPFGVAPTAMQRMAHAEGECANARACARMNAVFTLIMIATSSIEEVAMAAPDSLRFFQLYIYKDRDVTAGLVKRAENEGFTAIVLTVDAPQLGIRRADDRNKYSLPKHLRMGNFQSDDEKGNLVNKSSGGSGINEYVVSVFDPSLTWDDIQWLKKLTNLPIVVKGILTAEDALLAIEAGAAAIWVSNHGGRQVDEVPPTVFLGRPLLWGLACEGEDGAYNILHILKRELSSAMMLSGCAKVKDISRDMIIRREYYSKI